MKQLNPADSELIAEFLKAVRVKRISAVDDWKPGKAPGPAATVLNRVCCALQGILDGQAPDEALWITRKTGKRIDRHKELLAIEIRDWKLVGDKWEIILRKANDWRKARGQKAATLAYFKKVHAAYLKEIAPLTAQEAAEIDAWAASCRRF